MKTQTIIIGQTVENQVVKKKIEFNYFLETKAKIRKMSDLDKEELAPKFFHFIELICKNYNEGYDLMFAYLDPVKRGEGTLFIGKWNDGVME